VKLIGIEEGDQVVSVAEKEVEEGAANGGMWRTGANQLQRRPRVPTTAATRSSRCGDQRSRCSGGSVTSNFPASPMKIRTARGQSSFNISMMSLGPACGPPGPTRG
jgi:hypothetical protein